MTISSTAMALLGQIRNLLVNQPPQQLLRGSIIQDDNGSHEFPPALQVSYRCRSENPEGLNRTGWEWEIDVRTPQPRSLSVYGSSLESSAHTVLQDLCSQAGHAHQQPDLGADDVTMAQLLGELCSAVKSAPVGQDRGKPVYASLKIMLKYGPWRLAPRGGWHWIVVYRQPGYQEVAYQHGSLPAALEYAYETHLAAQWLQSLLDGVALAPPHFSAHGPQFGCFKISLLCRRTRSGQSAEPRWYLDVIVPGRPLLTYSHTGLRYALKVCGQQQTLLDSPSRSRAINPRPICLLDQLGRAVFAAWSDVLAGGSLPSSAIIELICRRPIHGNQNDPPTSGATQPAWHWAILTDAPSGTRYQSQSRDLTELLEGALAANTTAGSP